MAETTLKSWIRSRLTSSNIISAVVFIITLFVSIESLRFTLPAVKRGLDTFTQSEIRIETIGASATKELKRISQESEDLTEQIRFLESELKKLTAVPDDVKVASQLLQFDTTIKTLSAKVDNIEKVILNDPLKALEMPLLRNELVNIKNVGQSEILSLRQEITRIYDLNKWFVGLMFTMALGIIGLAVTNFIRAPRAEDN